jgi:hypothetical protein
MTWMRRQHQSLPPKSTEDIKPLINIEGDAPPHVLVVRYVTMIHPVMEWGVKVLFIILIKVQVVKRRRKVEEEGHWHLLLHLQNLRESEAAADRDLLVVVKLGLNNKYDK